MACTESGDGTGSTSSTSGRKFGDGAGSGSLSGWKPGKMVRKHAEARAMATISKETKLPPRPSMSIPTNLSKKAVLLSDYRTPSPDMFGDGSPESASKRKAEEAKQSAAVAPSVADPFAGVLVHRAVVSKSPEKNNEETNRENDKAEEGQRLSWTGFFTMSALQGSQAARSSHSVATMSLDQIVHSLPIFAECCHNAVQEIMLRMQKHVFHPDFVIVKEGSAHPTSIFLILWGSVDVLIDGQRVANLREGQSIGELITLGVSARWPCSLKSRSSCVMIEFSRQSVQETLMDYLEESESFNDVCRRHRGREELARMDGEQSVLRHSVAFRHCSELFLAELESKLYRRLYFPGEVICHQGEEDDVMFVFERGVVTIEIADRVVRTEEVPRMRTTVANNDDDSNSYKKVDEEFFNRSESTEVADDPQSELPEAQIFGETNIFGISTRCTATIRARRTCDVRMVSRAQLLKVLMKYPDDEQRLLPFMQTRDAFAKLNIQEHPLFGDAIYSKDFCDFIATHVEERIYHPSERIVRKASCDARTPDISLYLIGTGAVKVSQGPASANSASQLGPGSIIEARSIGRHHASARAIGVCYVSILHQGVLARALELFTPDREILVPYLSNRLGEHSFVAYTQAQRSFTDYVITKVVCENSIFGSISKSFVHEFFQFCSCRVYLPGDRIVEQGLPGASMFVLGMGTANVLIEQIEDAVNRTRKLTGIGKLSCGSIFGELAMIGVEEKRTASIVAVTLCCVWEVALGKALEFLRLHPVERANFLRLVEDHLSRSVAPRIIYHSLFGSFHKKFRNLLGSRCERRLWFPGDKILKEGTSGDRLYILNLGSVSVQVNRQHVMQAKNGCYFGFSMMTGLQERYSYTVKAETLCQVLVITQTAYQHALDKYPELRTLAKVLEADQHLYDKQKLESYHTIMKRRRGLRSLTNAMKTSSVAGSFLQKTSAHAKEPLQKALLETAFVGWHDIFQRGSEHRKELEEQRVRNARQIEHWLCLRRQQMEQVKPRLDMARLVDENLNRRGPLKMPKRKQNGNADAIRPLEFDMLASSYMSPRPLWIGKHSAHSSRTMSASSSRQKLPPVPGCNSDKLGAPGTLQTCTCGNVFAVDAVSCRHCGIKRPSLSQTPRHPASARDMTRHQQAPASAPWRGIGVLGSPLATPRIAEVGSLRSPPRSRQKPPGSASSLYHCFSDAITTPRGGGLSTSGSETDLSLSSEVARDASVASEDIRAGSSLQSWSRQSRINMVAATGALSGTSLRLVARPGGQDLRSICRESLAIF